MRSSNNPLDNILKKFTLPTDEKAKGIDRLTRMAAELLTPANDELCEDRLRCEKSLYEFTKGAWHVIEPQEFMEGWHIECICEHLQAMSKGDIKSMVLNLPPRHGKSLFACVMWFCWEWATNPSSRWMFASYAETLSTRDSIKCLDVIKSQWYQERWGTVFHLRAGQRAITKFANNKMGFRIATSIHGRALGEGGDFLVVDDGNKISEITSDIIRNRVNEWWSGTMSTRSGVNPRLVRKLCIQQRCHELDLSGYIINSDIGYDTLIFPAEYEPGRYFLPTPELPKPKKRTRDMIVPTKLQMQRPELRDPRTEEGELLWPARFGIEEIRNLKRELLTGSSGQLQQRPAPADGDIFKKQKFHYFVQEYVPWKGDMHNLAPCYTLMMSGDVPPIHVPVAWCRHWITADTAMAIGARNDYTAAGFFASAPLYQNEMLVARILLIIDIIRDRIPVPEQFDYLMAFWDSHADAEFLAVEPKASGIGLIQQSMASGRPFRSLKVDGDKIKRASVLATLYESNMVYHRQSMPMLPELEDELLSFPTGQHDDVVDCASYSALTFTHDKIIAAGVTGKTIAYPQIEDLSSQRETIKIQGVDFEFHDDDDAPPSWWS